MAEEFSKSVEEGLRLSKRIYFGNDRAVSPPRPPPTMSKSHTAYLPTAPMLYAVINDPSIVDNPDVPSYQPYVHGKCDPPALIPLHMNSFNLAAHCFLNAAASLSLSAAWRLHCISGSRSCDCLIAMPLPHQGSILGVEVTVHRKSYSTKLVDLKDNNGEENMILAQNGGFIGPNLFTLSIPKIDGGSILSVKISWHQKIQYSNDMFCLNVPFNFPDFVNPVGKRMAKKEKIEINVNAVTGSELICQSMSHTLKKVRQNAGSVGFLYESDVLAWSKTDFNFSYHVPDSSSQISGGVLLESASLDDFDQREMFCMYLSPGNRQSRKIFRKDIVFVIDISGSMRGKVIDETKNALSAALSKLHPDDSFSIIAFNGDIYQFSKSMESASKDAVERAIEWINMNFIAGGDTNISQPLNTAIEMLSDAQSSVPIIFLVTDGTVEDERQICDMMKNHMNNGELISPRIYTFGIGLFCNHYFLRMLAMIGRDLVEPQMLKLFDKASSLVLANITMDIFNDLDEVEVCPSHIPDLSSDDLLILSGRYKGSFPKDLEIKGVLADFSNFVIDMKIQEAKDIPVQRICARDQIEYLTAQAWLSKDEKLEEQVAKLSLQTGFQSEYTRMTILENDERLKKAKESGGKKEGKKVSKKSHPKSGANAPGERTFLLPHLGIGFGDLAATVENIQPGSQDTKGPDSAEIFVKAATNCCSTFCSYCCCMCCIKACTKINNQCAVALTQLCVGLGCFGCLNCCAELCCNGNDS
uniref:Inter-alpha-trypsin inhibitor heavy chain H1 n=1 Tax=Cajanus cajan TaxID=3821 RepID=A0A151T566_CAJCA|nr:Inter-alpha-trypsin inhibitor heavy chain H1 [Cajanus cajan]